MEQEDAMEDAARELLLRKLDGIAALTPEERDAVAGLPVQIRDYPARTDVVAEGEIPHQCCLLVSGLMIRYKMLPAGQRQIVNLHVPGDIPDLQSLHLSVMDHHLAALTPATAAMLPHADVRELNARHPRIAGALWRVTLIDAALLRERVVSLGQRTALNRLAHLLCETYVRLEVVGQAKAHRMTFPVTQIELADMLGMSSVHMNRTVQDLRARGLMITDGDTIVLPDWERLTALAGFDPLFLHIDPSDRPHTP